MMMMVMMKKMKMTMKIIVVNNIWVAHMFAVMQG